MGSEKSLVLMEIKDGRLETRTVPPNGQATMEQIIEVTQYLGLGTPQIKFMDETASLGINGAAILDKELDAQLEKFSSPERRDLVGFARAVYRFLHRSTGEFLSDPDEHIADRDWLRHEAKRLIGTYLYRERIDEAMAKRRRRRATKRKPAKQKAR